MTEQAGRLCRCGCGKRVRQDRNYRAGHRPPKPDDVVERIMQRVVITDRGCWEWQGSRTEHGYGTIRLPGVDVWRSAHRVMFAAQIRPLLDGEVLDHLCRNPPCCNPAHLDPVTQAINIGRGESPMAQAHLAGTCTKGHPQVGNVVLNRHGRVAYCKPCRRERRAQEPPNMTVCRRCSEPIPARAGRRYCGPRCSRKARWERERTTS